MFVVSKNCKSGTVNHWTLSSTLINLAMLVEKSVTIIYCAMTADKCYAELQEMSYYLRFRIAFLTYTKEKSEVELSNGIAFY